MNQHLEFCTAHTNRITIYRSVFNRRWGRKWVDTERSRKIHGPNGYQVPPAAADFGLLYRFTQRGSCWGGTTGALPSRRLAENFGLVQLSDPAVWKPRGRTAHATRAKELGENKGVADNGLTNTNTNILPTTNDDLRRHFGLPATFWCPPSRRFLYITWIKRKQFLFREANKSNQVF
jgi:hypothetical protein